MYMIKIVSALKIILYWVLEIYPFKSLKKTISSYHTFTIFIS